MQISVLSVQSSTQTAKSGKTYQQLEVTYKNLTFNKVESKKLMPFGAQKAAFDALGNAQPGSVFEVTVVKNAARYNDWTSVTQIPPGTLVPVPPGSINNPQAVLTKGNQVQVKSTYETPAERAQKQIYIVKQSSIGSAIELLSVGAKSPPSVDSVLDTAQKLYGWVMQSPQDVVKQDLFEVANDLEVE